MNVAVHVANRAHQHTRKHVVMHAQLAASAFAQCDTHHFLVVLAKAMLLIKGS